TRQGLAVGSGQLLADAPSTSMDVDAVGRGTLDVEKLDALPGDERPQDRARLAAEGAAQRNLGAQQGRHPGDPEPLSAGVQMDLLAGRVGGLDGDRQEGRGCKHGKRCAHVTPWTWSTGPLFKPGVEAILERQANTAWAR